MDATVLLKQFGIAAAGSVLWMFGLSPLSACILARIKPEWLLMHPIFCDWLPEIPEAEDARRLVVRVLRHHPFWHWPWLVKYLVYGYAFAIRMRKDQRMHDPTSDTARALQEWCQYEEECAKHGYFVIDYPTFRSWAELGDLHEGCLCLRRRAPGVPPTYSARSILNNPEIEEWVGVTPL